MKAFNKHGACIQPCTKGWKKEDKGEWDLILFLKVLCLLEELITKTGKGNWMLEIRSTAFPKERKTQEWEGELCSEGATGEGLTKL